MITKNDIQRELQKYDNARSLKRVGPFLYALDYFSTPLYYKLRNFYNGLGQYDSGNEELSAADRGRLTNLLAQNEVGLNSINQEIADLYANIESLVNDKKSDLHVDLFGRRLH